MNCLINHIGLKGCGQDDAASGYYINDLLSDALQQTAKLTTSEKATFTEIWNDIQKRAVRRFGADVSNFLSKKYRLKRVTDSFNLGTGGNTDTTTPPADERRGLLIDLAPDNGYQVGSALQMIHVQYLGIALLSNATVNIKVFDNETLSELDSFNITGVYGWNKVAEERSYNTTKLAILVDATLLESPATELPKAANACGCEMGCNTLYGNCCQATIKGVRANNGGIIETGNNTFGITGIFSVNCSYEGFVCANKNLFTYPLWQLLGYFMMDERVYSSRLNQFTIVNSDGAKERRDRFLEEYNRAMLDVLEGIDLCETGDCCLECNEQITMQEARM